MNEKEIEVGGTSSYGVSDPCPVCLGPIVQESYLDQCFHKFCYNCIVQWTKIVASKHSNQLASVKCPLCKRENSSIIHGCVGDSFQRQYVNEIFGVSSFFSRAHKYRLQCYYTEPGILNGTFNISCYWKARKYLQPNCWLQSWLRREIQALIQEEDVDIILHHILGVVDSFRRNAQASRAKSPGTIQEEFKSLVSDAARPFITARTDQFVNELELFLSSGLNVEAYDEVYMQRLGWNSRTAEEATEGAAEQRPVVPYLFIFDEDSDGLD